MRKQRVKGYRHSSWVNFEIDQISRSLISGNIFVSMFKLSYNGK